MRRHWYTNLHISGSVTYSSGTEFDLSIETVVTTLEDLVEGDELLTGVVTMASTTQ